MTKEEYRDFIYKTESLVKPVDVTAISFLGDFNKYLPKKTQDKMMRKGSSKVPYMAFIVDPYCFFLSYEITDTAAAQAMLSNDYELAETSLFETDEKKPLVIFSAFTARTSAFMGMRLECYIIARHKKSGLISWIIADYETNTNSHDPKNRFCGYTCDPAVYTITPYGELLINVQNTAGHKVFQIGAEIKHTETQSLDEELWVEGNMSVDYGGILKTDDTVPFSLIFDPILMKEAERVPLQNITIMKNTFFNELIDPMTPLSSAFFPYSQHYIIKQDLKETEITRKEDLLAQLQSFMKKSEFKTMKGDDIKKPLFRGMLISSIVTYGIILFLLIMLLL